MIERIKQYSNCLKMQKSVWLIYSGEDATTVRDALWRYMDANDRLFVTLVDVPAAWQNALCGDSGVQSFYRGY